jgi:hypothetical protein
MSAYHNVFVMNEQTMVQHIVDICGLYNVKNRKFKVDNMKVPSAGQKILQRRPKTPELH